MDSYFRDRLLAKTKVHLHYDRKPDPGEGLRHFISRHLHSHGTLQEEALVFLKRYWERVQPSKVGAEGAAHEAILVGLATTDKKFLDDTVAGFLKAHPNYAWDGMQKEIDLHYEQYTSKIRDEVAFLQAIRKREKRDDLHKWLLGGAVPVACVLLAAFLANDARTTLKEINSVRRETAELAHASVITSRLILDGEGRFGGMPAHKAAALKRINDIESRLQQFYPNIREEVEAILAQTNADAKVFWKKYEGLPQDKRSEYLKNYVNSGGSSKK